jgi:hypothetical protein
MSLSINGVSLDFRDRALEAAEYKCYKCGSDVNGAQLQFLNNAKISAQFKGARFFASQKT